MAIGATDGGLAFFAFEDAGEAFTAGDFEDHSTKSAALRALTRIHQSGVAHCDLARRHFRKSASGRVRLIDYSHSTLEATELDKSKDLEMFEKLTGPVQEA